MKRLFLRLTEYKCDSIVEMQGVFRVPTYEESPVAVNMTRVQEMRPFEFFDRDNTRIACTQLVMNIPHYTILVTDSLIDMLLKVESLCQD